MKQVGAEVEEQIAHLLRAGMTRRQVAYECRCSRGFVDRLARQRNIAPPSRGRRCCPLCEAQVIGMCVACAVRGRPTEELPRENGERDPDDPRPWELAKFYRQQDRRRRAAGELIKAADEDRLAETLEELL